MSLAAGHRIQNKYELIRPLGEGGYGEVWEGVDVNVGRHVAIKLLHARLDDQAKRRFANEAKVLGRLSHDHCVTLFDSGETDTGRMFLVTELIDGWPLDEWLNTNPPVEQRTIVALQVADALLAAHNLGIIHRDLKPDNILVEARAAGLHATVLDFGIAKLTGEEGQDVTKTGEVFGTAGFMSPEQLRGQKDISYATDIYALGVVLYEMFEERPPFEGTPLELAMLHLTRQPPPAVVAPAEYRGLILSMLSKKPADRPRTMIAVIHALRNPHQPRVLEVPDAQRTTQSLLALATALILAVIGAVAFIASRSTPEPVVEPQERKNPLSPPTPALVRQAEAARAMDQNVPDASLAPHTDVADETADGTSWVSTSGHRTQGCNAAPPESSLIELEPGQQGIWAYLPKSYNPRRPTPFVVVIHDYMNSPRDIVESDEIIDWTERTGTVLLVPSEHPTNDTWTKSDDARRVARQVKLAKDSLCLDKHRYFVLGLGNGGEAALKMASMTGPTAIAAVGRRHNTKRDSIEAEPKVPVLYISLLQDRSAPAAGGAGCGGLGSKKLSISDEESALRKAFQCDEGHPSEIEADGLTCRRHLCSAPVTFCRHDSGRYWSGMMPDEPFGCATQSSGLSDVVWPWFAKFALQE